MNRKPVACPDWYSTEFSVVDKQINESFLHKQGPGSLPGKRGEKKIKIIVVPQDPYSISGPCAAWAFKEIAEATVPDTFIVLGGNNQKIKASTFLFAPWETPLGVVQVNTEIGNLLLKEKNILNEASAHMEDHSIEVQLPFLQFACRDVLNDISFVPLSIGTTKKEDVGKVAESLADLYLDHNLHITVIVSCTIPHSASLQYINSLDTEGLLNFAERKDIPIQEIAPLLVAMEYARYLNAKKVRMLQQYQASAITKKKDDKTVYASLAIE